MSRRMPNEGYSSVQSNLDTNIEDELAGAARQKFRSASQSHRASEAARIAKENRDLRRRLKSITAKTDDGDGLFGSGLVVDWRMDMNTKRLEVEKSYRDAAADWYLKQAEERYRVHQQRLASMTSAIDDDTEDDATGESRARLRAESAARRQAQDDALRSANALYFAIINKTQSKTDSKVWDDGEGSAGAARSIVAAQCRARKEAERRQLEKDNASRVMRLSQVHAKVDDGDGHLDDIDA